MYIFCYNFQSIVNLKLKFWSFIILTENIFLKSVLKYTKFPSIV